VDNDVNWPGTGCEIRFDLELSWVQTYGQLSPLKNKTVIDIITLTEVLRPAESHLITCLPCGTLWANSIICKTRPRPQFGHVSFCDIWADRHTDLLIAILRALIGVNNNCKLILRPLLRIGPSGHQLTCYHTGFILSIYYELLRLNFRSGRRFWRLPFWRRSTRWTTLGMSTPSWTWFALPATTSVKRYSCASWFYFHTNEYFHNTDVVLCMCRQSGFLLLKILDSVDPFARNGMCNGHMSVLVCRVQVWYRVIQIVINRDDVQGYAAKTVFEVGSSYADMLRLLLMHIVFGRPLVKRFTLCYRTVAYLSGLSCLLRWCIVSKRLDGSRWNLAQT